MIENAEILLDLTEYRAIAGYVLALIALHNARKHALHTLVIQSARDAKWIAARLRNQGYTVLAVEASDGHTSVQVRI